MQNTDGYTEKEIKKLCTKNDAQKLESVELLAKQGWTVWASRRRLLSFTQREWVQKSVWVSEINYSDSATKIMPIYQGDEKAIKRTWELIIGFSRAYQYAEQYNISSSLAFRNWPRSMYKSRQTNSNTFVRVAAAFAGLGMREMDGLHPGDMTSSQNTDTSITGGLLQFYPTQTPWLSGGVAKTIPASAP